MAVELNLDKVMELTKALHDVLGLAIDLVPTAIKAVIAFEGVKKVWNDLFPDEDDEYEDEEEEEDEEQEGWGEDAED